MCKLLHLVFIFSVWRITTKGVHVSDEADLWFAKYLGIEGCKLYCYPVDGAPRKSKLRPQVAEKQFDVGIVNIFLFPSQLGP